MSDTQDVRSLITQNSRRKVKNRDASLRIHQASQQNETDFNSTKEVDKNPGINAQVSQVEHLTEELSALPEVGKRLAVHLEKNIRADLLKWCDVNEVTPETFVEAACVVLRENPEIKKQIFEEAQLRLQQRKKAGAIRRTLSMMEKYSG